MIALSCFTLQLIQNLDINELEFVTADGCPITEDSFINLQVHDRWYVVTRGYDRSSA